ncbi:MAG: dicarboxylate/amino acid:cation symporter [Muribaculaceae bacterium]
MKLPRTALLPSIIVAIASGIGCGFFFPEWLTRLFTTFSSLFSSLLDFVIPLLIVGFVAPAIAEIGRGAAKMLVATALLAYVFTIGSGLLSYGVSVMTFPSILDMGSEATMATEAATEAYNVAPYFTIALEPIMTVMAALVLAFILGLGASRLPGDVMQTWLSEFREIITMAIRGVIIPLLPPFIFAIFLKMSVTGEAAPVLTTFVKIIAVIFALHIVLLVVQYSIAWLFSGRNPFSSLAKMLPAYFTALGTQSSAATIPVTLSRTIAMGVNKDVAGFVIPLCATIHLSGSTLKIVACAMAIMMTGGMEYDFGMMAGFIAMLGITMIAAPGVPGGAIMASLGLLSSMLGFGEADIAMMIALYIAMDSFGTACNITGDGAIAQIIERIFARKEAKS